MKHASMSCEVFLQQSSQCYLFTWAEVNAHLTDLKSNSFFLLSSGQLGYISTQDKIVMKHYTYRLLTAGCFIMYASINPGCFDLIFIIYKHKMILGLIPFPDLFFFWLPFFLPCNPFLPHAYKLDKGIIIFHLNCKICNLLIKRSNSKMFGNFVCFSYRDIFIFSDKSNALTTVNIFSKSSR